jgi:hypothetical protein
MPTMTNQGPGTPGKPCRPSNGTEGLMFEERWCDHCSRGARCSIPGRSKTFELGDRHYPKELVFGADGWGSCTAFTERGTAIRKPRTKKSAKGQLGLF